MATEYETAREQYEIYRYCYDNGHQQWVDLASRCFDFYNSKQWDPAVKAQLEREGRPALTLNVIESLVRTAKGVQRALRNDVRYAPAQSGATMESARVKDAIWLDAQNRNQFEFLETEIFEKGLIMDCAYYDVRMCYDDSIAGQIKIRARRSQDVVRDPSAEAYDPDDWPQVFTRRWVSYNDVHHLYGKDKAEALGFAAMPQWYDYEDRFMAQQMGNLPYYSYAHTTAGDMPSARGHLLLERQYFEVRNKECFVDVETGDFSEIPESWDRNRVAKVLQSIDGLTTMRRKVKTIRWTVTCEDEVLHDEDSPYKHFSIVPYFPTYIDGVAMGVVRHLLDPQQLYNKMTSSELHIISTTANSGYKVKAGSLKNMQPEELENSGARTGFVAVLDDVTNLEKLQPNQTPQGHDRLSFKADQIMRQLSGVPNQARGFAREDVAGEAIYANKDGMDINFAAWLANLHRSKMLVARNTLDIAQVNFTETRTLLINRGTALVPNIDEVTINQPTAEGMVLNDVTRGSYTTVLVPAPSRATMEEADFKLLLELRKDIGIAIPDTMLIELSPASNKAQIIEKLAGGPDTNERQRQAEQLAAQQQEIDNQKAVATAKKEEAAAMLNQARAEKFAVEAASDPDASYERVEMARIESDGQIAREQAEQKRQEHNDKMSVEQQKVDNTKHFQDRQIALRLTELEAQREENRESRANDAVQADKDRAMKRREKKPT